MLKLRLLRRGNLFSRRNQQCLTDTLFCEVMRKQNQIHRLAPTYFL